MSNIPNVTITTSCCSTSGNVRLRKTITCALLFFCEYWGTAPISREDFASACLEQPILQQGLNGLSKVLQLLCESQELACYLFVSIPIIC